MATFVLITTLVALSAPVWSIQPEPCVDESCTNLSLFLGPKWGSKTIRIPEFPKFRGPSEVELENNEPSNLNDDEVDRPYIRTTKVTDEPPVEFQELELGFTEKPKVNLTKSDGRYTGSYTQGTTKRVHSQEEVQENDMEPRKTIGSRNIMPTAESSSSTPELSDEDSYEDYSDWEEDYEDYMLKDGDSVQLIPSSFWMTVEESNQLFFRETLNLTGFRYNGDQMKQALADLPVENRSHLRSLDLSRNQLQSLPALFFPVELEYGLVELRLDDNPLSTLDSFTCVELSRLGNLKVLSLARTGLQFVMSFYTPSLEYLDLSGNQLSILPSHLGGSRALQVLDLSGNQISTLSGPPPPAFLTLRVLNLAHNHLENVWGRPFQDLYNLDTLYLNNNSLKYTIQIEDVPESVSVLYLGGNPWECSCPLVRLVNQPCRTLIADKDSLRCTDQNIRIAWPVTSLREQDVTIACPHRGHWLKTSLENVVHWSRAHGIRSSNLLSYLWWGLLIGSIVALVHLLRNRKSKTPSSSVPYNILDEKHVI